MANKKTFGARLALLSAEANEVIEKKIKSLKRGEHFEIVSQEEIDENENAVNEAPFISRVGKYSEYDQYGILSIEHSEDGRIIFHTRGQGEASEEERQFDFSDLGFGEINMENLLEIADIIQSRK